MFQKMITTCGVMAVLVSGTASLNSPAYAGSKSTEPTFIGSEEQIGPRVYEVSRVTVKAPPAQVQDVITDYDHTEKVFDNVIKCKVLKDQGETKQVAFTIKTVGSMLTADYVLEITSTPGRIEWHRLSGAFKANEGFWKFEPVDGGRSTLVTYAKFIDGGMFAPRFIVNREIRNSMPLIMANLKGTAEYNSTVATEHRSALH